jgi:transposase InsO family protein
LERIHSDVVGPISPIGYDGSRYILTPVDDYTHFLVTYAIKNKVEVVSCIEQYEAAAKASFSVQICKFRCGNGSEYVTNELKDFFAEKGIQFEYTIPYSPTLNGVSERMNRTMLYKARSMLIGSGLPKNLWVEAVMAAAYLIKGASLRF